jgi:8-oxo-dGTP diphosphatase
MPFSLPPGDILLVVAAALIGPDGSILLQKRPLGKPMAGLWEFPGGKVDMGEVPESALIRELAEELGIAVEQEHLVPLGFASEPLSNRHLLLLLYRVQSWTGEIAGLDGQVLRWVTVAEMEQLEMPPADRPLVRALSAALMAVPSL